MEEEWRYMCPRPRRRRACNPCKERKTRCLRDEKHQEIEICRRYDRRRAIILKAEKFAPQEKVCNGFEVLC